MKVYALFTRKTFLSIIIMLCIGWALSNPAPTITPIDSDGNIISMEQAGLVNPDVNRFVGGTPRDWADYPYIVRIGLDRDLTITGLDPEKYENGVAKYLKGSSFCQGFKVGTYAFISSWHCIRPDDPPYPTDQNLSLGIYGGGELLQGAIMPRIDAHIECEMHPDFERTPYGLYFPYLNDVMLCIADRQTPNIEVVRISQAEPRGNLEYAGNGNTTSYADQLAGKPKSYSNVLMGGTLPHIPQERLREIIFPNQVYGTKQIGAGYPNADWSVDTNSGDSGGALVNGQGEVVANVSYGIDPIGMGIYNNLAKGGVDLSRFTNWHLIEGYGVQPPDVVTPAVAAADLLANSSVDDCECADEFPKRTSLPDLDDLNPFYNFIMADTGDLIPVEPYDWTPQTHPDDLELPADPLLPIIAERTMPQPSAPLASPVVSDRSLSTPICPANADNTRAIFFGGITRVLDGDTVTPSITLPFLGIELVRNIRLAGIDTPEMRGDTKPLAITAKNELERLTSTGVVRFEYLNKSETFSRHLACLWVDTLEVSVNDYLVNEGFATPFK